MFFRNQPSKLIPPVESMLNSTIGSFLFSIKVTNNVPVTKAASYVMATMGIEALETQRVVHFIGNGVDSLVRRAVADVDVDFETALARMNRHYADHLIDSTYLYPEVFAGSPGSG